MPRAAREADLLLGKAKSNDKLQDLIDCIDDMDFDDIDNLSQPKWVKTGLKQLVETDGKSAKEMKAAILQGVKLVDTSDKDQHPLCRWVGIETWIGAKFPVQLRPNDLFLSLSPTKILYDHVEKDLQQSDIQKINQNTRQEGMASRDQYYVHCRAELTRKNPEVSLNTNEDNQQGLFRIRRH